jgi:hypothetical protein
LLPVPLIENPVVCRAGGGGVFPVVLLSEIPPQVGSGEYGEKRIIYIVKTTHCDFIK